MNRLSALDVQTRAFLWNHIRKINKEQKDDHILHDPQYGRGRKDLERDRDN
jgi:hypothetical protein